MNAENAKYCTGAKKTKKKEEIDIYHIFMHNGKLSLKNTLKQQHYSHKSQPHGTCNWQKETKNCTNGRTTSPKWMYVHYNNAEKVTQLTTTTKYHITVTETYQGWKKTSNCNGFRGTPNKKKVAVQE